MEKNKSNSNKIMIVILSVLSLLVVSYVIQAAYFRRTGAILTQSAAYVTESDSTPVSGIAIRDEAKVANSVNTAILIRKADGIYQPAVDDGENVAKGDYIAYKFATQEQAQAYRQSVEIDAKIRYLSLFQKMGNTKNSDISALNSDITLSINKYLYAIEKNDFTNCEELLTNINYSLISRQTATGENSDFSKEITAYTDQLKVLSNQIGEKTGISAPFAGYFVSTVDGFEQCYDYKKLRTDGITVKQIEKLLNKKPSETNNAFGKIVGQHIWYFAFNIPVSQASNISSGSTLYVSFPEKGIENLEMTVSGMNKTGDTLAVVLKCKSIDKDILKLRKENAVISLGNYSGFKISNEAITDDGNGTIGVYVYSGQIAVFKPIDVVYRTDSYVLANPAIDEEDKNADQNKVLKQYDRIILKGRNLYDGKVLG
ncbi:MAG: HlyD family efflux transporter periplasmic adaptor subunit [Oscillospiraceae bacterium]|nr:HlyD family efflux transporter periplasmic adaptor subunit [Oscillospiraceae bacterium]